MAGSVTSTAVVVPADTITLVVPRDIGDCILHPVAVSELPKWIEAGVAPWT